MLCGVHTALRWSLCTPLVCAVLVIFLLFRLFFCFQRPRDFGEINKTRTSTSSKLCTAYDICVALPRKKPRAREIRCTLQGCWFRRIRLSMPLPRHAALRGLPLRSVFSDQKVIFKTQQQRPPAFVFCCRATLQSIGSSPEDPTK